MKSQFYYYILFFLYSLSLPSFAFNKGIKTKTGAEYLIITYNEEGFVKKLGELKNFRIAQGINTKLITTNDIGGNTVDHIKTYISEAYASWDIPPLAILLVGDHDKIPGPSFQKGQVPKTDISDNYYVDIDGDDLPEITIARLPINDLLNLTNYIDRVLEYETSPPNYSGYYSHPVTSMGWTDGSQFMFNAEVLNGFFSLELGKNPVQENDLFNGTPGDSWFVAPEALNYFGSGGLNYVPDSPSYLTDWSGNAANINANLNNGAFIMVNLDHGTELGWLSPEYWKSDIQDINSADPFFIISINNFNGKFNWSFDCFAEGLINHQFGAVGVIASTTSIDENISSEYYFALIDALWDNFMPDVNTGNNLYPFVLPAFANTQAKYQIAASGLPNTELTIYAYHYFGEPFTPIYYNYPDTLDVIHENTFEADVQTFEVTADSGSMICLSSNDEILSVEIGIGTPTLMEVENLNCNDTLIVTVTKQNYIRYSAYVLCNTATNIHKKDNLRKAIQLFPNPADNIVHIIGNKFHNGQASILLYDYSGKLIRMDNNISFSYLLERRDLPSGMYFLKVNTSKNNSENFKLIFK